MFSAEVRFQQDCVDPESNQANGFQRKLGMLREAFCLFRGHHVTCASVQKGSSGGPQGGTENSDAENMLLNITRDADRLDAIGAIGIARCFTYGGAKMRKLHDPNIPPRTQLTKESYVRDNGTTINHFYEKLLTLKDGMKTSAGKSIADVRHKFMEQYLEEFFAECEGKR
eukprot:gb/GECG01006206.1/.p1 GENE.gb/GECG01006206.1/~~gb/GECG01006206.1/.p1  ORF type:complete len:170 (+),score=22.05 gb/GECG01006206.1/:1-510(+)